MDLTYSESQREFQRGVREFLAAEWDSAKAGDDAFVRRFRALGTEKNYLNRSIPRRFGGSEQAPNIVHAQIIGEEFGRARAPMEVIGGGMMMLVPVLLEVGAEWQKERFVPKTVSGDYKWCQGYSEPGSGSDLASLRTSAELVDGEWVISGQKIWTTRAPEADFMFALVRTEPQAPKHQGLSYLLLDMKQPGITIRPLRQISGESEFSEVFFDDVRTPADWIVGERGKGWEVSKVNLKHERAGVGSAARATYLLHSLLKIARETEIDGKPAIKDPIIRNRIATIDGYVQAQLYGGYYQTTLSTRGEPAGVIGLCNKLNNTNIGQMVAEVATDIVGDMMLRMPPESGRAGPERWFKQAMGSLGLSIAGGTSNIQRNIIAERGLGLPRDPVGA